MTSFQEAPTFENISNLNFRKKVFHRDKNVVNKSLEHKQVPKIEIHFAFVLSNLTFPSSEKWFCGDQILQRLGF